VHLLLRGGETDPGKLSDSGIGPIHVACRFNNRAAAEMLLSMGALTLYFLVCS
jgi:ankyrin repeat protein